MVHLASLLISALAGSTSAHFILNYPTTVGFSDDDEGTAPCGGFAIDYSKATDFHVDGDSIAVQSTHPAAVWLFRATLDQTAFGGYENLLPAVSQDALGDFCETGLKVNSTWAGQKGVLQIVQDATDGLLYQCAAVNFVTGAATSAPSACKNVTGLTAAFTTASDLSAIPSATATGASESSASSGSTAATTSSSSSYAQATAYVVGGAVWAAAGLMGAALL